MSRYAEYLAVQDRCGHDPTYEADVTSALETIYAAGEEAPPRLVLWAESQRQATLMLGLLVAINQHICGLDRQAQPGGPSPLASMSLGALAAEWHAQQRPLAPYIEGMDDAAIRIADGPIDAIWFGEAGARLAARFEVELSTVNARVIAHPSAFDIVPTHAKLDRAMKWAAPAFLEQTRNYEFVGRHPPRGWGFPLRSFEKIPLLYQLRTLLDEMGDTLEPSRAALAHAYDQLGRATFRVDVRRHVAIVTAHPTVKHHVHNAASSRAHDLHATTGPALEWGDGAAIYAIHGTVIPTALGRKMVDGTLALQQVLGERNVEVRRALIDAYNRGRPGRLLRDANAKVLDSAIDARGNLMRLLSLGLEGDEPFVAIEVKNATRERDGSFKTYTLRVHPELRPLPVPGVNEVLGEPQALTCLNAIASLHGMYGHQYAPIRET